MINGAFEIIIDPRRIISDLRKTHQITAQRLFFCSNYNFFHILAYQRYGPISLLQNFNVHSWIPYEMVHVKDISYKINFTWD